MFYLGMAMQAFAVALLMTFFDGFVTPGQEFMAGVVFLLFALGSLKRSPSRY